MRSELGRALRFIAVGLSSTAFYLAALWALGRWIHSLIILTALCYLLSMACNFVLQSTFTFRAGPPTRHALLRFGTMHLLAMAGNSGLMYLLVSDWRIPLFGAQVAVTGVISVCIFIVSKTWVYRPVGPSLKTAVLNSGYK